MWPASTEPIQTTFPIVILEGFIPKEPGMDIATIYIELCNGLYEVAIIRIDEETGECVRREQWWIIVVDDDIYDYEFDEMNWQYALYTSFLIKLNFREQESTLKLEA